MFLGGHWSTHLYNFFYLVWTGRQLQIAKSTHNITYVINHHRRRHQYHFHRLVNAPAPTMMMKRHMSVIRLECTKQNAASSDP